MRDRANSLPTADEERIALLEDAGRIESALDSEGGRGLPKILNLLNDEQKARVWGLVTEVNPEYIDPALRRFEVKVPDALPMDTGEPLDASGALTPPNPEEEASEPSVGDIGGMKVFPSGEDFMGYIKSNPDHGLKDGDIVMINGVATRVTGGSSEKKEEPHSSVRW